MSLFDQVLILSTVSCIVDINHRRCKRALSWLPPPQHLGKERLALCLLSNLSANICIPGKTTHFLSFGEILLEYLSLFYWFWELCFPLLHVFFKETWWIWNGICCLASSFTLLWFVVFLATSWFCVCNALASFLIFFVVSQRIDQWQINKEFGVLP